MKYEILTYGHPVLRVRAQPAERVTKALHRLAEDMLETMYAGNGVGLAAQQIGQTLSICVIDVPPDHDVETEGGARLNPHVALPLIMVNPEIVAVDKARERSEEGCLSFPGIHVAVERALRVTSVFLIWKGERQTIDVRGFLARAIQHELDHLHGVLLVDRMSVVKKVSLSGQLKRLKAEQGHGNEGGGDRGAP